MTSWPDSRNTPPPRGDRHAAAAWLLGRHARLAHLTDRVAGVAHHDAAGPWIDLDHLAEVLNAIPRYHDAWDSYRHQHPEPSDDHAGERWHDAGPDADEICRGLGDFLVMSSGETGALRLLATLARERVPFRAIDLNSLDAEGHRLLEDWTRALRAL